MLIYAHVERTDMLKNDPKCIVYLEPAAIIMANPFQPGDYPVSGVQIVASERKIFSVCDHHANRTMGGLLRALKANGNCGRIHLQHTLIFGPAYIFYGFNS